MTEGQFFLLILIKNQIPFSCLNFPDEKYEDDIRILLDKGLISTIGSRYLLTDKGQDVYITAFFAVEGYFDIIY